MFLESDFGFKPSLIETHVSLILLQSRKKKAATKLDLEAISQRDNTNKLMIKSNFIWNRSRPRVAKKPV